MQVHTHLIRIPADAPAPQVGDEYVHLTSDLDPASVGFRGVVTRPTIGSVIVTRIVGLRSIDRSQVAVR